MVKNMILKTRCPFCKDIKYVTVSEPEYQKWQSGVLIQRAFPLLSQDDRERLLTGICPPCYTRVTHEHRQDNCPYCKNK